MLDQAMAFPHSAPRKIPVKGGTGGQTGLISAEDLQSPHPAAAARSGSSVSSIGVRAVQQAAHVTKLAPSISHYRAADVPATPPPDSLLPLRPSAALADAH